MINVIFRSIDIQSFQSIGKAQINLDQRGIVSVTGVNNYESNALSNGSGKSSIFSSLFWCLYGKTPEGISDPSNRYSSAECSVSLLFDIDLSPYSITRSVHNGSQRLAIQCSGNDITPRNKRGGDNLLRDSVLRLQPDLFLSLIYLSQGFASRLSSLQPAARKDRLEALTNTAEKMTAFDEVFKARYTEVGEAKLNLDRKISEISGSCDTINQSLDRWNAELLSIANHSDSFVFRDTAYTSLDIPKLSEQLRQMIDEEAEYKQQQAALVPRQQSLNNDKYSISSNMNAKDRERSSILSAIDSLCKDSKCPTCGSGLSEDKKAELELEYRNKLDQCDALIAEMAGKCKTIDEALAVIDKEQQLVQANYKLLSDKLSAIRYIIDNIPKPVNDNTFELKKNIAMYESQLDDLKAQQLDTSKAVTVLENKLAVLQHCRQLISKQFRSYMLDAAISFLNSRLAIYSQSLFSNESDKVFMSADSQRLDIYCGEALYDSLSGGERRKVDIAVMLAQRDLSSYLAGMSCNILILDEVLESLDESATQVCLSLLEQQANNVDSMFIISHNNYALPVDSKITVVKGTDHIATVISE